MTTLTNRDSIRALFSGANDKAFLDAACVSIVPMVATEAITKFLNDAMLSIRARLAWVRV